MGIDYWELHRPLNVPATKKKYYAGTITWIQPSPTLTTTVETTVKGYISPKIRLLLFHLLRLLIDWTIWIQFFFLESFVAGQRPGRQPGKGNINKINEATVPRPGGRGRGSRRVCSANCCWSQAKETATGTKLLLAKGRNLPQQRDRIRLLRSEGVGLGRPCDVTFVWRREVWDCCASGVVTTVVAVWVLIKVKLLR